MKETKQEIKEEIYTRKDLLPQEDDIKPSEYEKRINDFWRELEGIRLLLNNANRGVSISSYDSPVLTNFLLWRLLNELKSTNSQMKLDKLPTKISKQLNKIKRGK